MSTLLLAALLQLASADITFAQAETFARRDEASLSGELSSAFFDKQGKALGVALANCGVTSARQAAGLMVVMRLDEQGHVTKTWLNKPSSLGQCFEKELQSSVLPTDGRPEFYTFVNFNF